MTKIETKAPNLTLAEAAQKMGCSVQWARTVLRRLDRSNPGMGIVIRPTGNPEGRIMVNPLALRLVQDRSAAQAIEDLSERVGLLESDQRTNRISFARHEKRLNRLELRQNGTPCAH